MTREIRFAHHTIPKAKWDKPPGGAWLDEPDKIGWFDDETTGLPCLVVRGPLGALCGYVGITATHPWFRLLERDEQAGYDTIESQLVVHGGITYVGWGEQRTGGDPDEEFGICWPSIERFSKRLWIGFDCGHAYDLIPSMGEWASDDYAGLIIGESTYRTVSFVMDECERLAAQLYAAMSEEERAAYLQSAGLDRELAVDPATDVSIPDTQE